MSNIKIRITALEYNYRRYAVLFMGKKVAVAFDRDSGARVSYDARLIEGDIGSGGSIKNWYCYVKEGSIFELEIDNELFNKNKNRIKKWKMEVIENFSVTKKHYDMLHHGSENLE